MKNQNLFFNLSTIAVTLVIAALGVLAPSLLLSHKQANALNTEHLYSLEDSVPLAKVTTSAYDDILIRVQALTFGDAYVSEPGREELSMEEAVTKAAEELETLKALSVISELSQNLSLSYAEYSSLINPIAGQAIGVWLIRFEYSYGIITVQMDASLGKILTFEMVNKMLETETDAFSDQYEILKGFAEYLDILRIDSEPDYYSEKNGYIGRMNIGAIGIRFYGDASVGYCSMTLVYDENAKTSSESETVYDYN